MRGLGAVLLMAGGLWGALLWCRAERTRLALGRTLLRQLSALERGILTLRRPLGELSGELAGEAGPAAPFWRTLSASLRWELPFAQCWQEALEALPVPYKELLAPLGLVLSLGEREAASLLTRTEEDLGQYLRQERQRHRERERLAVALALSAAAML